MKLYMKSPRKNYKAESIYDPESKAFTVLKGSVVNESVSESKTFRGAGTISRLREKFVKNNVVTEDVLFRSASTAANFVTGQSTNGMRSWKTEGGLSLGQYLKNERG